VQFPSLILRISFDRVLTKAIYFYHNDHIHWRTARSTSLVIYKPQESLVITRHQAMHSSHYQAVDAKCNSFAVKAH